MTTTLTGAWGAPIEALEDMLAASSALQTWFGTGYANRIEMLASDDTPLQIPGVFIGYADGVSHAFDGVGSGYEFPSHFTGGMTMRFFGAINKADNRKEQIKSFISKVFGVISDLTAASGTSGNLCITSFAPSGPPQYNTSERGETAHLTWEWTVQI